MPRQLHGFSEAVAYFASEAVASVRRNGLMTVAAVTTVMVALLTVGTAVLVGLNLTALASTLEAQVEVVAFLRDGLPASEVAQLQGMIVALPGVTTVRFVGRAEALARLQRQIGQAALADLAATNPLPDSLEVNVSDARTLSATAQIIGRQPGVEEVTYGAQAVDRLIALTRGLRAVAAALAAFLVTVALTVVVNTVRLTVVARRQEIEIMRLVGATRWFIRWPLLIEGVLQGAGAAAAAALMLTALYAIVSTYLHESLPFLPIVPVRQVIAPLAGTVLTAGIAVGTAGSLIAVRRFLST